MNKEESQSYLNWYLEQRNIRVNELSTLIRSDPAFCDWKDDFTLESLDRLSIWFCKNVQMSDLSDQDISEIKQLSPKITEIVDIPKTKLSWKTKSLCFDIGIYLSSIMEIAQEGLHWEIGPKPISNIHYNQPVLRGNNSLSFNPTYMVEIFAYKINDGDHNQKGLRYLHTMWINLLNDDN